MDLSAPIGTIKYVGPKLAQVLSRKGIRTVEDALFFLPRTYEDRRRLTPIASLSAGVTATVMGTSVGVREVRGRGRGRTQLEVSLRDSTGILRLFWFRSYPALKEDFAVGKKLLVHGDVSFFGAFARMTHPDYEAVQESGGKPVPSYHFGRVVPVYSETEGLHQKTIRRIMAQVLKSSLEALDESLPEATLRKLALPSIRESFIALHFPKELPAEGVPRAEMRRVVFEEFFTLQLGLALKKRKRQQQGGRALVDCKGQVERFVKSLPFLLTGDQRSALDLVLADMAKHEAMSRLLQGDVGSGKTVVALAAAVAAASSGVQTAIMAPTEVLAQQHFRTAQSWLSPLGVGCVLFTQESAKDPQVRALVASGGAQVVIGTHALFQSKVAFHDLGLVVVDEQHRFGVEQRGELIRKAKAGSPPDLLMMTATPIPRTLALTLYGDLDVISIREKPASRKPIATRILSEKQRPALYSRIRAVLNEGRQVYFIYPLVEDSEKLDLKSATRMHEMLSREVFPEHSVALLHGRMKPEQKDAILSEFKQGNHRMLVATTVIEVGIDVPNATLMVIEHPERLGLSQLHQLRGRVGRGEHASECILLVEDKPPPRLRIMEQTQDGFRIAEEDLRFRGPGEFLGTHQSGLPGFRAGNMVEDADLLLCAQEEAQELLEKDPHLELPENGRIRTVVENRWKLKMERLQSGY